MQKCTALNIWHYSCPASYYQAKASGGGDRAVIRFRKLFRRIHRDDVQRSNYQVFKRVIYIFVSCVALQHPFSFE